MYESLIQETVSKLDTLTGFEKKGLILKMLSKLKQLCNHPALYLKEPFDDAEDMMERSEKLAQIVTLAGEIASTWRTMSNFHSIYWHGAFIATLLN